MQASSSSFVRPAVRPDAAQALGDIGRRALRPFRLLLIDQVDDAEIALRPAAARDHPGPEAEPVEIDLAVDIADAGPAPRSPPSPAAGGWRAGCGNAGKVKEEYSISSTGDSGSPRTISKDLEIGLRFVGRLRVRHAERQERARLRRRPQQGCAAQCGRSDARGSEKKCSTIHCHPPDLFRSSSP